MFTYYPKDMFTYYPKDMFNSVLCAIYLKVFLQKKLLSSNLVLSMEKTMTAKGDYVASASSMNAMIFQEKWTWGHFLETY